MMNMDKEKFSLGDMVILLGWWGAMRAKIAVESAFQGVTRPEVCGCEESKELRSALEKATKALEALRTEAISGKPEAFVDRKGCNFHQQNGQVFDTFCHSCWRAQWPSAPKASAPRQTIAQPRITPEESCVLLDAMFYPPSNCMNCSTCPAQAPHWKHTPNCANERRKNCVDTGKELVLKLKGTPDYSKPPTEQPVSGLAQNSSLELTDLRYYAEATQNVKNVKDTALDEELQQIDDVIVEVGGEAGGDHRAFIRRITKERDAALAKVGALERGVSCFRSAHAILLADLNALIDDKPVQTSLAETVRKKFAEELRVNVAELEARCETLKSDAQYWKAERDKSDRQIDELINHD